jgi:ATP-dependent RNA helicase DDX52/ROK1
VAGVAQGFLEQIDEIVAACSHPKVTRALFSATLPPNVEEMARTILRDPINVTIGEKYAQLLIERLW